MFQKSKIFIFLILLCIAVNAFSQTRQVPNNPEYDLAPYHFGFLLGFNQMYFTIKTVPNYQQEISYIPYESSMPDLHSDSAYLYNMESEYNAGFSIGIIGNLRLGNHFDLRFTPTLAFGQRELYYTLKFHFYPQNTDTMFYNTQSSIQSAVVEFPLWMRFKGERIHNVRPYVMAGGKYSIDLASNANVNKENDVSCYAQDFYAMGGFGFDFYTPYFKFGTEISMSYGLKDILKHNNSIYTTSVDYMRSKIFQISFTFE